MPTLRRCDVFALAIAQHAVHTIRRLLLLLIILRRLLRVRLVAFLLLSLVGERWDYTLGIAPLLQLLLVQFSCLDHCFDHSQRE